MAYPERKKRGSLWSSFKHAFSGVLYVFRTERNIWIHSVITIVLVVVSCYLGLSRFEWIVLILTMAVVIGLEMVNTAIEATVDIATDLHHPLAKKAKDVAAGAVLVGVVGAIIIGLLIFIPHFI